MSREEADTELRKVLELTKTVADQKQRQAAASEAVRRARESIRAKREFIYKGAFFNRFDESNLLS